MTDVREYALMIKGFLQASHAPPELLAGIEQVINALEPAGINITMRTTVAPENFADLTRRFIENRTQNKPAAISSNSVEKQEVKPNESGDKINTTLQAIENIRKNSPNFLERDIMGIEESKHNQIIPAGNISEKQERSPKARAWTDAHRAAQSERMKARHAAKLSSKGGRQGKTPSPPRAEDDGEDEDHPAMPAPRFIPTDPMGELLQDVKPGPQWKSAYQKREHDKYVGRREKNEPIQPGDLVDIHAMLAKKMALHQIAALYNVTVKKLEEFILKHKNAQITVCAPRCFTGDNVIKPMSGSRKSSGY